MNSRSVVGRGAGCLPGINPEASSVWWLCVVVWWLYVVVWWLYVVNVLGH